MTIKEKFRKVIEYFEKNMPVAETELNYNNVFELIVAVILSAQCTDKRVNIITSNFFKIYPSAIELAVATYDDVFSLIKTCSYPNNKTKHLLGMAKTLVNEFNNVVPSTLDELCKLPGVGRKTANVVLSVAFNKPALAVDTHVFRVANRIGLTQNSKTPLNTEKQLLKFIPENKVAIAHHWLILHGRYVCKARKPNCENCGITKYCTYYNNFIYDNR